MIGELTVHAATILWVVVLAAMVLLSGLYCGMETGVYVVNKIRLELRSETGSRSAGMLKKILNDSPNLLAILIIGENTVNYVATFAISALLTLHGYGGEKAEWLTLALATPLLFIFAESVPKNIFQLLAENLVYRFAWLLRLSSILFNVVGIAPLLRGFAWLLLRTTGQHSAIGLSAHEGIATVVAEGQASGLLTHSQSIMADRVMRISRVSISQVMNPMRNVATVRLEASRDEVMEIIARHNYSRLPIINSAGQVTGVLNVYDVLMSDSQAVDLAAAPQPLQVLAAMTVTDAFYHMQREKSPMAVVAGRSGKHIGIVTLKDLVEEIVGELEAW